MRRRFSVVMAVFAVVAVTGFAGPASGGVKLQYGRAYKAAGQRCGDKTAPGRNVYREGSTLSNGKKVKREKYVALTGTLDSMCRPVPTAEQVAYTATPAPTSSSSGGSCPAVIPQYIIEKESGGNPAAVNASSGAFGCYQLMPEHFESGGACAGLGTDVAGQAECAQRLPPSAWAATR